MPACWPGPLGNGRSSRSPAAHLRGDHDLVDALAREHLADHPDSVLVAWIAAAAHDNNVSQSASELTQGGTHAGA